MSEKYWFPIMARTEIISALAGWRLSVSEEQLVKPSPDFVMTVYNACLEQVTDLNHQSLYEPAQNALNSLEDPNPVCCNCMSFTYLTLTISVSGPLFCWLVTYYYALSYVCSVPLSATNSTSSSFVSGPVSLQLHGFLTSIPKTFTFPIQNVLDISFLPSSTSSNSQRRVRTLF